MSFATRLDLRQSQVFRMGHVIRVFEMTGEELHEHLLQAARHNPFLVVRQRRAGFAGAAGGGDRADIAVPDAPNSLYDHALRELAGLIAPGGAMRRLVLALVEELEPTGWLGRPLAEIAADLGFDALLVERTLRLIQRRVSPAGLFARDLRECLRLQLEDQGLWQPDMAAVLVRIALLERGGAQGIAAATGLDLATVTRHLAGIRRLDPKPGARFRTDLALLREPDMRVERRGAGWVAIPKSPVETQVSLLPVPAGDMSAETRRALAEARALKQALDLRQSALQAIMRVMLEIQGAYFDAGDEALRPLTLSAIAERTGFHLSTVSRVLNGLLIEGANGIVEARALCARSCGRGPGDAAPKPRVLSRLKTLLSAECRDCPISDRQLCETLQAEGLCVSRRVVSKYRQELGFSAAGQRRKRA